MKVTCKFCLKILKQARPRAPKMMDEKIVDQLMARVPEERRNRWCEASGGCSCMGCVNMHLGTELPLKLFTKTDWEYWVARTKPSEKDKSE